MTNFGDVITDAKGGNPRYQGSITVASAPAGPNPMQYGRDDASLLSDNQVSGIAQDLASEGVDHGYYNQYDDPDWFLNYTGTNLAGITGVVTTWINVGSIGGVDFNFGSNNDIDMANSNLDTTGNKYRGSDIRYATSDTSTYTWTRNLTDNENSELLGSHTVGAVFAKIRMDSADDEGVFWSFTNASTPASGVQEITLRFDDDLRLQAEILSSLVGVSTETTTFQATANTMSLNTWHRIGFRQDGTSLRGWVDGVETPFTVAGTTDNQGFWLVDLEVRSGGSGVIDQIEMFGENGTDNGFVGDIETVKYTHELLSDSMMAMLTNPDTSNF